MSRWFFSTVLKCSSFTLPSYFTFFVQTGGLDFFFFCFLFCALKEGKKKHFLSVTCSCLCLACFSCSFPPNVELEVCRCYATATHLGHHVIRCFLTFSFLCVPWLTMWLCRPIHSDSDITVRAACKPFYLWFAFLPQVGFCCWLSQKGYVCVQVCMCARVRANYKNKNKGTLFLCHPLLKFYFSKGPKKKSL